MARHKERRGEPLWQRKSPQLQELFTLGTITPAVPFVVQASGQLKCTGSGFLWRRKQGSKVVEVKKDGEHSLGGGEAAAGPVDVRIKYPTTVLPQCIFRRPADCTAAMLHARAEIEGLSWMKVPRGCQLSIQRKEGTTISFLGFRERVSSVTRAWKQSWGPGGLGPRATATSWRRFMQVAKGHG